MRENESENELQDTLLKGQGSVRLERGRQNNILIINSPWRERLDNGKKVEELLRRLTPNTIFKLKVLNLYLSLNNTPYSYSYYDAVQRIYHLRIGDVMMIKHTAMYGSPPSSLLSTQAWMVKPAKFKWPWKTPAWTGKEGVLDLCVTWRDWCKNWYFLYYPMIRDWGSPDRGASSQPWTVYFFFLTPLHSLPISCNTSPFRDFLH